MTRLVPILLLISFFTLADAANILREINRERNIERANQFNLCKAPIQTFKQCWYTATDFASISKDKGVSHSLKAVPSGYGEGVVVPPGCKVTLYSTSSHLAEHGNHPDSHALIITGPKSVCASQLLKTSVKAIGIEDNVDLEEVVNEMQVLRNMITQVKRMPGPKGEPGLRGATGPTGEPGLRGATGLKGVKGEIGARGITGSKGEKGQTIVGATGARGAKGDDGLGLTFKEFKLNTMFTKGNYVFSTSKNGKGNSMFIAEKDFRATKQPKDDIGNWVEFQAPKGEDGKDGRSIVGPTGPPGAKGDTGATGAAGTAGRHGPTGPRGEKGSHNSAALLHITRYVSLPQPCADDEIFHNVSGCTKCPINTYKSGVKLHAKCLKCPSDTPYSNGKIGLVSVSQCTTVNCTNGLFYNYQSKKCERSRFVLKTSGTCRSYLNTAAECRNAATQLLLSDTTVSDDYQNRASWDPKGCYFEGGSLKFNRRMTNTGSCSNWDRCLCLEVSCENGLFYNHTSNKCERSRFVLKTSGTCPSYVNTAAECRNAATQLLLSDTTVSDDYQNRASWDPKGCYFEGGSLKFNRRMTNTGNCSYSDRCLCRECEDGYFYNHTSKKCTASEIYVDLTVNAAPGAGVNVDLSVNAASGAATMASTGAATMASTGAATMASTGAATMASTGAPPTDVSATGETGPTGGDTSPAKASAITASASGPSSSKPTKTMGTTASTGAPTTTGTLKAATGAATGPSANIASSSTGVALSKKQKHDDFMKLLKIFDQNSNKHIGWDEIVAVTGHDDPKMKKVFQAAAGSDMQMDYKEFHKFMNKEENAKFFFM